MWTSIHLLNHLALTPKREWVWFETATPPPIPLLPHLNDRATTWSIKSAQLILGYNLNYDCNGSGLIRHMNLSQPKVSSEEVLKTSPPFTTLHNKISAAGTNLTLVLPSSATASLNVSAGLLLCSSSTSKPATLTRQDGQTHLKEVPRTKMPSAEAAAERLTWNPFTTNCIPTKGASEARKLHPGKPILNLHTQVNI